MNKFIMKNYNRKEVQKFIIIIMALNLVIFILSFFTDFLYLNKIIGIICTSLIGVVNLICIGFIIKISRNKNLDKKPKTVEIKYDPILTRFIVQNKVEIDKNLIMAELMDLNRRGHIIIEKTGNDCEIKWKDENTFKRMNDNENMDSSKWKEYLGEDIKPYENLFITKIVFAFENKLLLSEINKKAENGYYTGRLELFQFSMEKMIVNEAENKKLIVEGIKNKPYIIIILLNIIISVLAISSIISYNVFLMLTILANIIINVLILKNEKALGYQFSDESEEYIEDLNNLIENLKNRTDEDDENFDQKEILKILFKIKDYEL